MSILNNASIWTIHMDNLYMISEVKKNADITSHMLIFKKAFFKWSSIILLYYLEYIIWELYKLKIWAKYLKR